MTFHCHSERGEQPNNPVRFAICHLEKIMDIAQILTEHIKIDGVGDLISCVPDGFADAALPCFKFAKMSGKSPQQAAEELVLSFPKIPLVEKVEAVNGYLNFTFNPEFFSKEVLTEVLRSPSFGGSSIGKGKTICIDYSSVNIAKTFHIGHLGTTVIGNSLKNIFNFLGYKTVGINHLGDWGTQFGKLITAFKKWGNKRDVEKRGVDALQEIYVKFHAEEESNPALTEQAREWFAKIERGDKEALALFDWFKQVTMLEVEKIYSRLGVEFDYYQGESFYNDKMDGALQIAREKGIVVESDGAEIVSLDGYGMAPCLLVKADGATLYATRDIAAAIYRKTAFDFYKCLYVVAYQQNLHFKQFFKVLELMGFDWSTDLEHIAYGMVSLEEGPMSTRKGNYVKLCDLLDKAVGKALVIIEEKNPSLKDKKDIAEKIGVGAVVFSALCNARIKDNVFSFDKVLNFDGETCPYLQYTVARTNSVLEKAAECKAADFSSCKETAKLLNYFPQAVSEAAEKREPSVISKYLIDLARSYNKFYFDYRIQGDSARLMLTEAVGRVLKTGLALLGIACPEKM